MTETLLNYGADVDTKDKSGVTPLYSACWYNYAEGTRLLLNHGADINVRDNNGYYPLSLTIRQLKRGDPVDPEFLEVIMNHINKLQCLGYFVSQKNLKMTDETVINLYEGISPESKWNKFKEECESEIFKLMRVKIDNYTSLYDILKKSVHRVAWYAYNEEFQRVMTLESSIKSFPLYGYLMKPLYERSVERRQLLDPAVEKFKTFTENFFPDVCVNIIFEYFSNDDLKALIRV